MFKFNKINLFFSVFILVSLLGSTLWGHGEDKTGPHGGFIRMPGSFHTEVVDEKDGAFSVYLLDIEFKNPVVADSEVKAFVLTGRKRQADKKKLELKCEVVGGDHFRCVADKKVKNLNKLILKVVRSGVKGTGEAIYDLPLKRSEVDHSQHNM